jgi:8-oxo-dGTP diphosphatase
MNPPQRREIACAVILDTQGQFLLQQRDDIPGIIHPGKISLFGGHREGDESFLQCAVREVHEELSYYVAPERFEPLAVHDGSDFDVENGAFYGEFFVVRHIPVADIVVTEGTLLIVERGKLRMLEGKLTPSAHFALDAFFRMR